MSDEKRSEEEETTETKDAEKAAADAEGEGNADDAMDPAAIARRVAALGEEDEAEKLAREEERKLAERRAAGKKGKKKRGGGLEVAASKKLEKIGKRAEPKRDVAVAADADPLIERTQKLSDWAKQNQKLVQRVGALIAVALIGLAGWMYWDHKRETEASMALSKAVETQHAQIGEPPKDDDDDAAQDNGPYYKTHEERREKALEKYREVAKKYSGTGAAILARLAEASLLLDKRDADGAAAAYTDVKNSPLGQQDKEVKGRALEGLGFAYELKADKAEGDAKKPFYDQALQAFKELENTVDVRGFKEMAMYHQARVLENKGDKEEAKKILLALKEKFDKNDDTSLVPGAPGGQAYPYLREVAMDRLRNIDPDAAPKIQGIPGGGAQVLPPHLRKMIEEQQKKAAGGGGDPHGH